MKRPWDSILWWEIRRIPFNGVIGLLGLATIMVIEFLGAGLVKPADDVDGSFVLLFGALIYGLGANVAYTLGWITEIVWSSGDTTKTQALRPRIFWTGLIFSAALTLLPAVVIPAAWAVFGFYR